MCSVRVSVCVLWVYVDRCTVSETEKEKTLMALMLRDLPLVWEHLANMTSWTGQLPFTWLKSNMVPFKSAAPLTVPSKTGCPE